MFFNIKIDVARQWVCARRTYSAAFLRDYCVAVAYAVALAASGVLSAACVSSEGDAHAATAQGQIGTERLPGPEPTSDEMAWAEEMLQERLRGSQAQYNSINGVLFGMTARTEMDTALEGLVPYTMLDPERREEMAVVEFGSGRHGVMVLQAIARGERRYGIDPKTDSRLQQAPFFVADDYTKNDNAYEKRFLPNSIPLVESFWGPFTYLTKDMAQAARTPMGCGKNNDLWPARTALTGLWRAVTWITSPSAIVRISPVSVRDKPYLVRMAAAWGFQEVPDETGRLTSALQRLQELATQPTLSTYESELLTTMLGDSRSYTDKSDVERTEKIAAYVNARVKGTDKELMFVTFKKVQNAILH